MTSTGDQKLLVDVYRQNNVGEVTIGIDVSIPAASEGIYTIPEELTFNNGEYKAVLTIIAHDVEAFAKGAIYAAKIAIGDHHDFKDIPTLDAGLDKTRHYQAPRSAREVQTIKYTEITISTSQALDWQPAYILRDFGNLLKTKPEGTKDEEWYMVDGNKKPLIQTADWYSWKTSKVGTENLTVQRAANTSVFRILNAGDGGANIIFSVDSDASHKVMVDGTSYFRCVMTEQDIKVAYDASSTYCMSDWPTFFDGEITYDEAPCYWDGANSFIFAIAWHLSDDRYFFDPSPDPTDIFAFRTGNEEPDPSVEITYLGAKTSATGIKSHSLKFVPNADTHHYYATIIKEDLSVIEDEQVLTAKLTAIQTQIEAGTYQSAYPVLRYTAQTEDAWNFGTTKSVFTALTFAYAANGVTNAIGFQSFSYNPDGDASEVDYTLACGAGGFGTDNDFTDYSLGYFGDNSVMLVCAGQQITAVKYVMLTQAAFDAAGLTDNSSDAALAAYVDQNGRAFNEAMLADVNGITAAYTNYVSLPAQPSTTYKVICCVSNPDAMAVEMQSATTEAAASDKTFEIALSLAESASSSIYQHTHVFASFAGGHVVGGHYLLLPTAATADDQQTSFGEYFTLHADGTLSLKSGVTDEQVLALIQSEGSALSTGNTTSAVRSALYRINTGNVYSTVLAAVPATEYVMIACADHDGTGPKSWQYALVTTAFAPSVHFSQTLRADGRNLRFTWSSDATDALFKIQKVVYALVPKSELVSGGVNMALLSDEQLNDFDARRAAAGADKVAIDAQQANAQKLLAILGAKGKTLKNDAVAAINRSAGLSKQFEQMAVGEYVLIAKASDTYNTKLTVGQISIQ